MDPLFTMQYGEFAVAEQLAKKIKDASVYIPLSAQEKGIDLLLYKHKDGRNVTTTVQVKMSRGYRERLKKYPYQLWFRRFDIQDNADWYVLVGIYAKHATDADARVTDISWEEIMLAFTNEEMKRFMSEVKQKKDPSKDDKFFYFGFDEKKNVFQTRGYPEERDMSSYLIENRLADIEKSFK